MYYFSYNSNTKVCTCIYKVHISMKLQWLIKIIVFCSPYQIKLSSEVLLKSFSVSALLAWIHWLKALSSDSQIAWS